MIEIIPNFHPVVVHFPIALTIVAFISALSSQLFKKRAFASHLAIISHYMLWLAAATAIVAVAFGWLAYNSVNHDDAGHAAMTVHKYWAFTTAVVLVLLALLDFKKHLSSTIMPLYLVGLLGLASGLVGATAWLGGEVVYRHGIGVMSLPAQESSVQDSSSQNAEGKPHEHGASNNNAEVLKKEPASMEGHDMNAMPAMDETTPKPDQKAPSHTHDQVQDESKPHAHTK